MENAITDIKVGPCLCQLCMHLGTCCTAAALCWPRCMHAWLSHAPCDCPALQAWRTTHLPRRKFKGSTVSCHAGEQRLGFACVLSSVTASKLLQTPAYLPTHAVCLPSPIPRLLRRVAQRRL